MPKVYIREDAKRRSKFHRTDKCPNLLKSPAKGQAHPLLEVELTQLDRALPCKWCYRDLPRIRTVRTWCETCRSRAACQHNGGIRVVTTYQTTYTSVNRDPGDEIDKHIYVWPDQLRRFIAN